MARVIHHLIFHRKDGLNAEHPTSANQCTVISSENPSLGSLVTQST